jgi:alkaline phosphatase D
MRLTSSIRQCIGLAAMFAVAACSAEPSHRLDIQGSGRAGAAAPDPGSSNGGTGGSSEPPPLTGVAGTPAAGADGTNSAPDAGAPEAGAGGAGNSFPGSGAAGATGGASGAAGGSAGTTGGAGGGPAGSGVTGAAGSTPDAGKPAPDAGAPTDVGKPPIDAGDPRPEAGTPPAMDAGTTPEVAPPADNGPVIQRIGFGSCNDMTRPQTFWPNIVAKQPQVFLFLGDNAYLDYGDTYEKLGAEPGFKSLIAIAKPLAIWDDHDFGMNDGGSSFAGKDSYKKKFIDFWGGLGAVPASSPRRTRAGNYDATILGPVGRQVQFIMLDNRYFKTAEPSGTVLGDAQWQWLADQLRQPADLRVIMSGFQALGSSTSSEGWGEYPAEQQHLLDVIKASQARGVVIVSGDKHYAEISRRDGAVGYPLYDFTSSSLSASNSYAPEPNVYRDTPTAATQNHNFGLLTIDWATAGRPLTVQIFDANTGSVLLSKALSLATLGS